jgi:hypothetical protein
MRVIKVASCYNCPYQININASISRKKIHILDRCMCIDEPVGEYIKAKTFHPKCILPLLKSK